MIIYNFWCPNSGCTNPNKKRNFQITLLENEEVRCEFCGMVLKRLGVVRNNYANFNPLPPVEKKRLLKKRSTEHYHKYIKEKKEWMGRAAITGE
ncbi:MAG: hypothetical protein LBV41_00510 [Cytophagaceae bacterium]|jgi:hypothetical protein|nr:hypothetical protein [Cytophagaceae bacterium]